MAACCFIGEEDESKKIKFVIDNIEADTEYSAPFKKQLEKQLKSYIKKYAHAIGVTVIEQGPDNNDLTVAEYGQSTKKIGGYNRPKGYYFEGERENEDDE